MRPTALVATLAAGTRCKACGSDGSLLCGPCIRAAALPAEASVLAGVDRLLARWSYEGAPRSLVLDLKLRAVRAAAEPLARGLVELVRREGSRARSVTWPPGRARDMSVRGFDHAEVIARSVAGELGLPALPLLERRRRAADQSGLSRVERRSNLVGAFASRPITGWVVVVDDVVTSGATAEACAAALRQAGAAGVEFLAACRA